MTSRRKRIVGILPYLLMGAGAWLLFLGARDLFDWHFGQREAARQYQKQEDHEDVNAHPVLGESIGLLAIPRLGAELYVVEGDGDEELRLGPGHLQGTPMPGQRGNCVIAGHRDTHFRILKDIQRGDRLVLETRNGQYVYRVKSTKIVLPEDTASLQPTSDAELNLVTCYPFYYVGSAPKRFIVRAELAKSLAAESGAGTLDGGGGHSGDWPMYNGSNARGEGRVLQNSQAAALRVRGDQ